MSEENCYDFIIVGGGCSGLSAAMYATRLGLKTLCLAELPGGLITTTHLVENWPGVISISGPDLAMELYNHAQASGAEIKSERVTEVENIGSDAAPKFRLKTLSNEYTAKTVLLATGTEHRKLGVPGEEEYANKGVSYCALCDGAFFKEKNVCVVGGGDSAAKEAIFLSEHAKKVYLVVRRDVLRAEPLNAKRIEENPKIEVLFKTEIEAVLGDEKSVTGVKFKEGEGKHSGEEMEMDGVFMAIGHDAQTELAEKLGVDLNQKKEIKINRRAETNIKGVFGAGDCCDTEFKQAITGSAEAVTASYYAYEVVNNAEVSC